MGSMTQMTKPNPASSQDSMKRNGTARIAPIGAGRDVSATVCKIASMTAAKQGAIPHKYDPSLEQIGGLPPIGEPHKFLISTRSFAHPMQFGNALSGAHSVRL